MFLELLRNHGEEDAKVICDIDQSVWHSYAMAEKVQGSSPVDVVGYV